MHELAQIFFYLIPVFPHFGPSVQLPGDDKSHARDAFGRIAYRDTFHECVCIIFLDFFFFSLSLSHCLRAEGFSILKTTEAAIYSASVVLPLN